MTFLLDHDAPEDLPYSLEALGHGVVRLRDVLPLPPRTKRSSGAQPPINTP